MHRLIAEPEESSLSARSAAAPLKRVEIRMIDCWPGYFYVMLADVNPVDQGTWQKSESEAATGRCLYVDSIVTRNEVHEGRCMVRGSRLSTRMFRLVNTSAVDEYGIRAFWGACWQPKAEAGADDAETAADGVYIVSVSSASGCDAVLQRWRIEPVDPTAIVGKSS